VSKRYDETIEVTPDPSSLGEAAGDTAVMPLAFSWRGRRYEIDQQLASWREGAEWWVSSDRGSGNRRTGRGPRDRDCYRVLARPAGALATGDLDPDGFMTPPPSAAVYDLAFDRIRRTWCLSRIWD
jgi:hypothetical protein